MNLFYTPDIAGGTCNLDPEESQHIVRVMRLGPGDKVYSTDGMGNLFLSEILSADRNRCTIRLLESFHEGAEGGQSVENGLHPLFPGQVKRPYRLHLAVAPTKNIERFEWFLEKATEIGIDEVTPLLCEHSERKALKPARLEKVIISAMKQSLKVWKPVLHPMARFQEFIKSRQRSSGIKSQDAGSQPHGTEGKLFIAHLSDQARPVKDLYQAGEDVTILIGPEGDFSAMELQLASDAGFLRCTLGKSRLRTETAAVVATEVISLLNGS